MFNLNFLKKMSNSLEKIVLVKHPILKKIKIYLTNLYNPEFVRMTGQSFLQTQDYINLLSKF